MVVTDSRRCGDNMVRNIRKAAEAGLRFVQIREKDLTEADLGRLVRSVQDSVGPEVVLVVNGSPETAIRYGTGVHFPASVVRQGWEPGAIRPFGCSVHDLDELQAALAQGPDYLVAGTVFATESKPGRAGIGPQGVRKLVDRADGVPVYAIGGINQENLPEILEAGAWGVAVVAAVLRARDPGEAVQRLLAAVGA